jgi:hypothetical protein
MRSITNQGSDDRNQGIFVGANTVRPYLDGGQKTEGSGKFIVIPAQAGIQNSMHIAQFLDSRLRGNDGVDWADIRGQKTVCIG